MSTPNLCLVLWCHSSINCSSRIYYHLFKFLIALKFRVRRLYSLLKHEGSNKPQFLTVCLHSSGGLSNLLYYVALPDALQKSEKECEPKEVLIRIYGQCHGEKAIESLITDSVIFTLLSERGLGPKLHGIFPGGRIEEYINARPLLTKEMADEQLSTMIAQKMAAIHSMEVRRVIRMVRKRK